MPIFRQSSFKWECDRCGVPFVPGRGGVCTSCRDTLCDFHLHGSFFRKMRHAILDEMAVCVRCRAEKASPEAPGDS